MSGPVALNAPRSLIAGETILVVIFLELSLCSVRDGKSGSCWEPSARVELHEKFLAEDSFVTRCCQELWAI